MNVENSRHLGLLSSEELQSKFSKLLENSHLLIKSGEQKYEDLLSHWVLSVAFSQTEELRRRIIQFETDLFTYRFNQLSTIDIRRFVDNEELGYEQCSDAERDGMMMEFDDGDRTNPLEDVYIANVAFSKEMSTSFTKTNFYKIPFAEVSGLVRARKVFVKKGIAYVTQKNLISALTTKFQQELQAKLETAARSLVWAAKDDRMGPLLHKLQTASIGNDMSSQSVSSKLGTVKLEDVPSLAKRSFPLCARNLEQALTKEHHLKHTSRLQYTLFLKGIGLTMDDCIAYFQREFGKRPTTTEEFRKKGYLYSIKHSYGQEGKRANYTPWSCSKAIANRQTSSDHRHGCPFQEFTPEKVAAAVKETGIPEVQIREIVARVKNHDFQVACRLHWMAMHPGGNAEPVGNHPNAWFDESMKYWAEKTQPESTTQASATITTNNNGQPTTTQVAESQMEVVHSEAVSQSVE
jgi:DNA primase large subunit